MIDEERKRREEREEKATQEEIQEAQQAILKESFVWIKNNPNAKLSDLPDELLEEWIDYDYGEDISEDNANPIPMSVFLTAFMEKKGKNGELKISEKDIIEHYQAWQEKLNLQSMHNCGLITLDDKRIKLFSFSKKEKIKIINMQEIETTSE